MLTNLNTGQDHGSPHLRNWILILYVEIVGIGANCTTNAGGINKQNKQQTAQQTTKTHSKQQTAQQTAAHALTAMPAMTVPARSSKKHA